MSSTMSNPRLGLKGRTFRFGILILMLLFIVDYFLVAIKIEEKKTKMVLDQIQSDEMLSGELYRLFFGLENDFNFFEAELKEIHSTKDQEKGRNTLINFLNTHPQYFKVRITEGVGKEIFKIFKLSNKVSYEESKNFFDLSQQGFFQELKKVKGKGFAFSSMEANIIDGKIETPLRPTIRVSKRASLPNIPNALLIFNIDGKEILQHFKSQSSPSFVVQKILVDHLGRYVASYPLREDSFYVVQRPKINHSLLESLNKINESKGSLILDNEVIVFTKIPLPGSLEKWFLVSRIAKSTIKQSVFKEMMPWLLWELICFSLLIVWSWRDEKKHHKEQVVQVLLKERGEFIQNVSHQLKTPLTIIHNDLSQKDKFLEKYEEIKKEISHLIKVVEDLLLLSQVESFKDIPLKNENIVEVLIEAIELVAKKAKEKEVYLKLDIQNEVVNSLHLFEKDVLPELLKSAICNVLDNAIDYSPKKDTISIIAGHTNGKVVITIKDNGPGVQEDLISTIFNRFSRDSTQARKGSGLGLAITKKIVKLHHGEVTLRPSKKGATFEIVL